VLLSAFLTGACALVLMTAMLLLVGHRLTVSSRLVSLLLGVLVTLAAGEAAGSLWSLPSRYVVVGQAVLLGWILVCILARPVWNVVGQVFYGTLWTATSTYLAFAVDVTISHGLSATARAASAAMLVLEVSALVLSGSFAFESCDAICRTRPSRREPRRDPNHLPMVSLQLAAYNEPPDMLIDTIRSLEAIDYPRYEILVIDNNTQDPEVWRPVEEFCRDRPKVTFVHVDPWPGFKSGALNLALQRYTHPDAEVIGIVDSDYVIDAGWLRDLVGYFADPAIAFVQTPQDYREYEGDEYLEACYDAYRYFFVTSMPARNQRNSIIFAGTMGLLRRSALEEVGGWDEWCITEDAELSLRLLKAGYSGQFVPTSYGHGVMPLTFAALKSQRFRWCFGGMQILRLHWRDLLAPRGRDNHLTGPQRVDYLLGSIQWMNDLVYLAFSVVLLATAVVLAGDDPFSLRPLHGATALLPAALIFSGVLRALWSLRVQTGIGVRRAMLAFLNWLSLSWTVALACLRGLTRREGTFLRTPKEGSRSRLLSALWSARAEAVLALVLWSAGVVLVLRGRASPFLVIIFAWQGVVYAAGPFMSWLNQHTELSAQLERRRRTEAMRERIGIGRPVLAGSLVGAAAAVALAVVIATGGSHPGQPQDPFASPGRGEGDKGVLTNLIEGNPALPPVEQTTTTTEPSEPESSTTTEPDGTTTSSTTPPTTTTPDATTTTAPTTTTTPPPTTTTPP
jgi:cellulose synthase/poly-beta-1,6-N-acetylglucosamine synthase-like glycosyltransferase